jgi:hypothetical protein
MTYELTVQEKPGYLHICVTGVNSRHTVQGYLADVAAECAVRKCWSILVEEDLKGPRLDMVDIYEITSEASQRMGAQTVTIAYVDVNAGRSQSRMQFAETVAVNRGVNVRLFATVREAEQWLRETVTATERHATARTGTR